MLRLPPFDKIGVNPPPEFQNADPANGVAGSIVNGLVFNQLQHEGENLELLAGLTPSGIDLTQWAQAVSRGGIWAGNLTGTGDLAVATLGVVIPDLLQGMRVGAIATATNTVTNPKLRVANKGTQGGYTDYPILKEDGSALAVGDIKAGRRYRYEADGAGNVLITGGGIGGANGGFSLLNLQVLTASGTYTPAAGAKSALAFLTAGGGAGGSSTQGNNTTGGLGDGGESGATALFRLSLSGVASVPVTIGAGGQPSPIPATVNTRGGTGGASQFGTYASVPGGQGGLNVQGSIGPAAGGTTGGTLSNGALGLIIPGNPGTKSAYINPASGAVGGNGGASFWGGAGLGAEGDSSGGAAATPGGAATGYGSGGGGCDSGAQSSPALGGAGKQGVAIILEFA